MQNRAVLDLYHQLLARYGRVGVVATVLLALVFTVVMTALAVAAVVWMPADHFSRPPGQGRAARRHPVARWTLLVLKNLIGASIVPLGVLLAVPGVPGPGLVFILIGLSLLDFPGKRRLERRLLATPAVLHFLNRVRVRFRRPPLVL
jgi:hypothetical protein